MSTAGSDFSVPVDEGWILLAEGNAPQAVVAFERRVSDKPGNMMAKVGLALSYAAVGDLSAGAWHMRQACSSDVLALKLVRLNDELRHRVDELIGSYESALAKNNTNRQKLFMLASLHFLAGDKDRAAKSISRAIRNGDRTSAARYLQHLIAEIDVERRLSLAQN